MTYTHDIVLLAKNERNLKEMMNRFKKFIARKGLILSSEKSKENERGRKKKKEWDRKKDGDRKI